MGFYGLRLCVCLFAVFELVASQTGRPIIKRPYVAAQPLTEDTMNQVRAECARRMSINSTITHFAGVPGDCSAFAICDTTKDPSIVLCPIGEFFNDDMAVLSCTMPYLSNCQGSPGDPCVGRPDGYIQDMVRSQMVQGAYYACVNGVAIGGGWCELGEQYLGPDLACFAIPDRPVPPPVFLEPVECHLMAVEGSSTTFVTGNKTMTCPGDTQFIQSSCGCE